MRKNYFEAASPFQPQWIDIKTKEWCIALPLIMLILWVGLYPTPILRLIQPAANKTFTETGVSK